MFFFFLPFIALFRCHFFLVSAFMDLSPTKLIVQWWNAKWIYDKKKRRETSYADKSNEGIIKTIEFQTANTIQMILNDFI